MNPHSRAHSIGWAAQISRCSPVRSTFDLESQKCGVGACTEINHVCMYAVRRTQEYYSYHYSVSVFISTQLVPTRRSCRLDYLSLAHRDAARDPMQPSMTMASPRMSPSKGRPRARFLDRWRDDSGTPDARSNHRAGRTEGSGHPHRKSASLVVRDRCSCTEYFFIASEAF